ncbi:IS1 family transposase [Clostridium sp. YIM B02505]|uniref:IS1 family transposase n=1 Tax=Clostridium yunnanense TaxID=2800325 RepID=A0ABS1EKX6_9CLOT|nr:IS1 family transposase [Clostridium yunnanense]MBK1810005.1 IS1 family transposase [Clostridium yunnanense]
MLQHDVKLKKFDLHTNDVLKRDFYKNRVVETCPICESNWYIKYGFYNGIQRYKCKVCEKTFSRTTNSLWSYSKKNTRTWVEFTELMTENKTLKFCADKLNISIGTAFYWRHKILEALSIDSTPDNLSGVVHVGKVIIKENFKGCRDAEMLASVAPRENIFIIGAKGKEDSMFIKPIFKFKYRWDNDAFNEKVYSKIEKKSYIAPYGDRYIKLVAMKHNRNKSIKVETEYRIKYLWPNLKKWLSIFHGVASKYLQRYLSFFIIMNLDKVIDYMDLIYDRLFEGNRFMKTDEIRIRSSLF